MGKNGWLCSFQAGREKIVFYVKVCWVNKEYHNKKSGSTNLVNPPCFLMELKRGIEPLTY
ncbi:hypothetical protein CPZ25_007265 [Eubacterium maltosivorans]|uniref:Uncharacterized protein n=1 Tax=Eubacterium maltosivorans TaxID=2041044 RepID=A0A4P9C8N9_EUBML|nr:hypothetical protein CPZ25_007265 [Eubacterium maltosivorans]